MKKALMIAAAVVLANVVDIKQEWCCPCGAGARVWREGTAGGDVRTVKALSAEGPFRRRWVSAIWRAR
jgi:hypothetical protein